jgi:heme exporter protein CcmD
MNHDSFVIAAYAISAFGLLWLLISSVIAMRRSEALADDLRERD